MNFIDFTNFIYLFRQGQEQPHHPVNKTGHHDGCRNRKNPGRHDIRGRSPPNRSNPFRDSNPDNRAGNRVSRTHGNPQHGCSHQCQSSRCLGTESLHGFQPGQPVPQSLDQLKFSRKSIQLTARNSGYIIRLGFSAFLGEAAIGVMMLTGNYVFVSYLGTDGVAAFSIMCYFFPIIFMVFNAIIQSAQPIISFNHGCAAHGRAQQALRLALIATIATGLFFLVLTILLREQIVSLFIAEHANNAWKYAVYGIPFFSICYVFFGINITSIGYYMSIEKSRLATIFTVLRGIILPVVCFFLLPLWLEVKGIWLAVAVAEFITFAVICINAMCKRV